MKAAAILFLIVIQPYIVSAQGNFNQELTSIAQNLGNKLSDSGKTILVANFTDLQSNQTELGRFLAEALSVELISTNLVVIDRSGKDVRLSELGFMDSLITIPEARRKFGKQYGIDYLIKGTMTLLDNTIDINIKVLDIYRGVLVAGIRSQLTRTDAINNLLRNNINSNNDPANKNVGRKINTENKSPIDDLFEARISDLRYGECKGEYFNSTISSGQLCFENQTGEDLMFYSEDFNPSERLDDYKISLPNGGRNCSRLIVTNFSNATRKLNESTSRQTTFVFYTLDGKKYSKQSFVVDECKVKSFLLTKKNLIFIKY